MESDNSGTGRSQNSLEYESSLEAPTTVTSVSEPVVRRGFTQLGFNKLAFGITAAALSFIILVGLASFLLSGATGNKKANQSSSTSGVTSTVSLKGLDANSQSDLGETDHLVVNGRYQVAKP